jgi:hypothetical protein
MTALFTSHAAFFSVVHIGWVFSRENGGVLQGELKGTELFSLGRND